MADLRSYEAFRALEALDHVPAGHKAYLVPDNEFAPHLKRGEFAVVDTTERRISKSALRHISTLWILGISKSVARNGACDEAKRLG